MAVPLLTVAPPVLLTVKTPWVVLPTARVPKFKLSGLTSISPGVKPAPLTVLAEPPPLLVKFTEPLYVPEALGAKATVTVAV